MIAMPVGVRVWLANGHSDMRRYADGSYWVLGW